MLICKMVEPGAIQPLNAVRGQQVAVRDQAGENGILAHVGDDLVELGMQKRFAAADSDD